MLWKLEIRLTIIDADRFALGHGTRDDRLAPQRWTRRGKKKGRLVSVRIGFWTWGKPDNTIPPPAEAS